MELSTIFQNTPFLDSVAILIKYGSQILAGDDVKNHRQLPLLTITALVSIDNSFFLSRAKYVGDPGKSLE